MKTFKIPPIELNLDSMDQEPKTCSQTGFTS